MRQQSPPVGSKVSSRYEEYGENKERARISLSLDYLNLESKEKVERLHELSEGERESSPPPSFNLISRRSYSPRSPVLNAEMTGATNVNTHSNEADDAYSDSDR